ncbi:MAG TPA: phosphotransferase [Mycobacteriales bacterium]|nr:phosphotransferase [Mycobacteriales bacterium]
MDIDLAELSRAVGSPVSTYTVTAIEPDLRVHSVTGGVYRVTGEGFSLVIKVVQRGRDDTGDDGLWVSGESPEHRNYWKREWLAYSTGLLDALPGELRAPRTLLTTTPSDDECWIWMEDVEGYPGREWAVADYDSVAFDLGTTQAAFASGRSILPSEPWLARGWLRSWVALFEPRMKALDDPSGYPQEWRTTIETLAQRVQALWDRRESLLAIVESAPLTLVHADLWPANLIAADDGTTVALDWSQIGIGALAQDLDQLILDPVWMQVRPDTDLEDLETNVLRGYGSGLRSSGIDLPASTLRHWYAAAASVHYAPMLGAAAGLTQPDIDAALRRWNRPYPEVVAHRATVIERALDLGEWALARG